MSLITKTVKVKWIGRNKKHYVDLGYEFTKMGDMFDVKIEDLQTSSNIKIKYTCDSCGKECETAFIDYNRRVHSDGNHYCNTCSMMMGKLKKTISFEQWCVKNNREDVLFRWDYDKNKKKPNEIPYGTDKKFWFKCAKHPEHHSELKCILKITREKDKNVKCNQCNSLGQWFLDNKLNIDDYWDYNKNIVNPWEISKGSENIIWIKCQKKDYHGSYDIACADFVLGGRCRYCSGRIVHPKDSIGQYIIDNFGEDFLYKIWSDKNNKSSFEYSCGSPQEVWWNCENDIHKQYKRRIESSRRYNFRCPQCSNERKESFGEEEVRLYLEELGHVISHEHNCTIRPINPKTKQPLPYDNEIILDNGEHLLIEVHGEQHYNLQTNSSKWIKNGFTPEQQLHYQQVKDRYKRIYAIQHNYYYLEIPYTAFNAQETYKKLIDDKINEIKQIKNNQQEESA